MVIYLPPKEEYLLIFYHNKERKSKLFVEIMFFPLKKIDLCDIIVAYRILFHKILKSYRSFVIFEHCNN